MSENPYHVHLGERILSSDPMELVVILYQELVESIREARRSLSRSDIRGRAAAVSKALALVGELSASLQIGLGGELGQNLSRLYFFLASRIQDGNFHQVDGPFAECEAVASTLLDGWRGIARRREAAIASPVPESGAREARALSICG